MMNDLVREYLAGHGSSQEDVETVGEEIANAKACVGRLREVIGECNQWLEIVASFGVHVDIRIEHKDHVSPTYGVMQTKILRVNAKISL